MTLEERAVIEKLTEVGQALLNDDLVAANKALDIACVRIETDELVLELYRRAFARMASALDDILTREGSIR